MMNAINSYKCYTFIIISFSVYVVILLSLSLSLFRLSSKAIIMQHTMFNHIPHAMIDDVNPIMLYIWTKKQKSASKPQKEQKRVNYTKNRWHNEKYT